MKNNNTAGQAGIVPLMRYRDVNAAITWLNEAFGFETQFAARDEDGSIFYAQLTYGSGLVMVGSDRDSDLDSLMRLPDEIGGCETQCCYVFVDNISAHLEKAKAAGAEIVLNLQGDEAAGRGYSCRDPQGHIWNIGEYHPGKATACDDERTAEPSVGRTAAKWGVGAGLSAMIIAAVGAGALWLNGISAEAAQDFVVSALRHGPIEAVRPGKIPVSEVAEPRVTELQPRQKTVALQDKALKADLALHRGARLAAERDTERVREALGRLQRLAKRAKDHARELEKRLSLAKLAETNTERIAQVLREDLARERIRAQSAQVTSKEIQEKLAILQQAKTASDQALNDAEQQLLRVRAEKEALAKDLALAALANASKPDPGDKGVEASSEDRLEPDKEAAPAKVIKEKKSKKARKTYKKRKKARKKRKKKYKKVAKKKKKTPQPAKPLPAFNQW